MKNFLLAVFILIFTDFVFCQTVTISGKITDTETGEVLPGVTIYNPEKLIGGITNSYGFYSVKLPVGKNNIMISSLGYEVINKNLFLEKDTTINFHLLQSIFSIVEIHIVADQNNNIESTDIGYQKMSMKDVKSIPAIAGEVDILKSIQYLPGVQASNEGTANLSVRGGSHDQNLILLDEAAIYNPSHILGFVSIFNSDAIKSVDVYKSTFPSKYDSRLSSIVDIRMNEGNNKELNVKGGIGLISSKLLVEGPIKNEKSSFLISGRYNYSGTIANLLYNLSDVVYISSLNDFSSGNEVNFYDLNLKFNFKVSEKDHLFLSGYKGSDHFYFKNFTDDYSIDWGNQTATLRWNHIFNSSLFSNTTLVTSRYDYEYILKADIRNFNWNANLEEYKLKSDFDYYFSSNIYISTGIFSSLIKVLPGSVVPANNSSIVNSNSLQEKQSLNCALYIEPEIKLNEWLKIRAGLRYSLFMDLGENTVYSYSKNGLTILDTAYYKKGEIIQTYNGFMPRASARIKLNELSSIKLSYSKNIQYFHLLSNSTIGLPTDIWYPSGKNLTPQFSNQFSIGYYKNSSDNIFESTIELYYKDMHNVTEFKDNADLFMNEHVEAEILQGNGRAYGLEFLTEKKIGKIKGWISYTISKVEKKIEGINQGNYFPATYDKRHNLSLVASYDIRGNLSFSTSFKFISGGYTTLPIGTYNYYGASFNYYSNKNSYQLPNFHELNVALNWKPGIDKNRKWKHEWIFAINNIYNRKNTFAIYSKQDNVELSEMKLYNLYLYGIFPSITYNFNL